MRVGLTGKDIMMKEEYDFSESRSNPYAKKLRHQITIRLDNEIVEHFKD
jgi:uncharacterized protein (DUF4415 family)